MGFVIVSVMGSVMGSGMGSGLVYSKGNHDRAISQNIHVMGFVMGSRLGWFHNFCSRFGSQKKLGSEWEPVPSDSKNNLQCQN